MKELKQKVIELGIERGYLPHDKLQDSEKMFNIQYHRLITEIGEAHTEVRKSNQKNYLMELGDILVLQTNCYYIAETFLDIKNYYPMLDNARDAVMILNRMAHDKMPLDYSYHLRDLKALEMAYNKILNRGGVMIGNDYFKPTDPEYIKYMQENENNI